jgi:hypothetical protein
MRTGRSNTGRRVGLRDVLSERTKTEAIINAGVGGKERRRQPRIQAAEAGEEVGTGTSAATEVDSCA